MSSGIVAERDALKAELASLRAALAQAEQEIPRLSEQNRQLGLELFEAQQLRKQAERERDLAKRLVNRLPLCPDHRDKFQPEQCQACRAEQAEQAVANERKDSEDALTERDAFQAENHRLLVETMELRTRLAEAKQRGRAADAYDAVYRRLMESSAHGRLDSDVWYALTKAHDMLDALQPPLKNSARHRAAQP